MTKSSSKALPTDALCLAGIDETVIADALGDTCLPGTLGEFAEAMLQPKQKVMRLRRAVAAEDLPIPTSPVPWYRLGRRPSASTPSPSRLLAFAAADYYIQDAGSLLPLALAGADTPSLAGMTVCDLCAAPGGKASALVEAMDQSNGPGGGFVLANETIGSRIGALKLALARTGSDRYAITNLDPDVLADRLPGTFDVVVVDAPCSGQALLSQRKQKVSSLTASHIRHNAARQSRILDAALRLVRGGGRIVYSTCTFAEAENETQVKRLVSSGLAEPAPVDRVAAYETRAGCYRLWPHLHQCAGSFAASLIAAGKVPLSNRGHQHSRRKKLPVDLEQWYRLPDESIRLQLRDSVVIGWPRDAPDWVDRIAIGGPELAHRSGRTWRPAHSAAMRRVPRSRALQACEIDAETAKQYLRGEPIECVCDGWAVVCLGGRPLGWIKGNRRVGKNHLPASARMQGELLGEKEC